MNNKPFSLFLLLSLIFLSSSAFAISDETIEITVIKKDYLINICKNYLEEPRQWKKIARLNRLENPDLIFPGQRLQIPIHFLKKTPIHGTVTFIKGEVTVQGKGTEGWRALSLNDIVKQGNGIKTGEGGIVEITFEDGASLLLRPATTLDVATAEKKSSGHFLRELYLRTGRTISKLREATGRGSRFEIQTPSAIAAARGTAFRVSVDAFEATRSEVLHGTIGVGAMNRTVNVNEGEGTLVRKNEPPLEPKRLLPPPELVHSEPIYKSMPLTFRFRGVKGAFFFRVMLARDSDFKDVVQDTIIKPEEPSELHTVDDGVYFLQSRSIDADGLEGLPSAAYTVRIRTNPLPPYIQSPVDRSEHQQKSVSFEWLKVRDAVRYHLQIAEDSEFSSIILDKNDIGDTTHVAALLQYRSYYFRVSSVADDGYEGAWSDILSFSIVPPPPAMEKPELDRNEIHIRWGDLGQGVTYHFQMALDTVFRDIVIDEISEKPMITLQRPEKTGTYFVRTSSIDTKGRESDFSSAQSFDIKDDTSYKALAIIGTMWLIILLAF